MFVNLLLILLILMAVAVAVFVVSSVYSLFVGAPYVPMDAERVERMLDLVGLRAGERLADLGSGDGRIIVAAARRGAHAEGWEISPLLWLYSTWNIRRLGLQKLAKVHLRSFWPDDMAAFSVVTLYLIPGKMEAMEAKLKRELPSGSRVVSYAFSFKTWAPESVQGQLRTYRTGASAAPLTKS